MSKTEIAKQLAKQTAEQKQNTETSPNQTKSDQPDKELTDFLGAIQMILQMSTDNQQQLKNLETKLTQIEKDHWKQIRMLIVTIGIPLILCITILLILISRYRTI